MTSHFRGTPLLLVALLAAVSLALIAARADAQAASMYASATTGYDISWPQCGGYPQPPYSFGIVGVNGGRAFSQNPCLQAEYQWAAQASTPPSLYMNLNYPVGTTASQGTSGPAGNCSKRDKVCQAYNYGYNAAQYAFSYAASQGAATSLWWLDIETANTWSAKAALNEQVIRGAIDYLYEQGLTVGIYSTRYQWTKIAGSFSPALPIWIAGAPDLSGAQGFCSNQSYWFAGGAPWLVQYSRVGYDSDYAC